MEFRGIKLYIVIIVTLLIVCLFFAARYLLAIYRIDKPLRNELASLEGIKEIEILENKKGTELQVSFLPGIDFYELYQEIEGIMENVKGEKNTDIIIINDSDNELREIYYQVHFALYEGISTGRFLEMKKNIDDILRREELDGYLVRVDRQAVYLQLDKDNHSFYYRIPYNDIGIKEGG